MQGTRSGKRVDSVRGIQEKSGWWKCEDLQRAADRRGPKDERAKGVYRVSGGVRD